VAPRETRERDRGRDHYADDNVALRGFGLRIDPKEAEEPQRVPEPSHRDERRGRKDLQKELDSPEPTYRDDRRGRRDPQEELDGPEPSYRDDRASRRDYQRELEESEARRRDFEERERRGHRDYDSQGDDYYTYDREPKPKEIGPPEVESEDKKDRLRDKLAAGLGMAAASLGLASAVKDSASRDGSSQRAEDQESDYYRDEADSRSRSNRRDSPLSDDDFEIIEMPSKSRDRLRRESPIKTDAEVKDRYRQGSGSGPDQDTTVAPASRDSSSSAEDGKSTSRRRRRASSVFNPNDTAGLEEIKAQLAAAEQRDKSPEKSTAAIREPSRERNGSPSEVDTETGALVVKDESRGRELAPPGRDERQVRVVSPPKDKEEKKPIKGILKQPKPQFPEEPNPVREGVAPHKDDKTKTDVPADARWTKISRRTVNPEALMVGKERFEVRDDFVIVLRALSRDEIEEYAIATAQLRERRRREYERERREGALEPEPRDDELEDERRRRHRHHRRDRDDVVAYEDGRDRRDHDRERERGDRHRRHRHAEEEEEEREYDGAGRQRAIEYSGRNYHNHRPSHRHERDREVAE